MSDASRTAGKLHFLVLIVNMFVAIGMFATAVTYYYRPGIFYSYMSQWDLTLLAMNKSFFILAHLSFVAWMFLVHRTMLRMNRLYTVEPADFLVQMLPFVHIWGLGSSFNQLRKAFAENPALDRSARRLKTYIPLIYISYSMAWVGYISLYVGDTTSMIFTLAAIISFIVMYAVFLTVTYTVNQTVYAAVTEYTSQKYTSPEAVHMDVLSQEYGVQPITQTYQEEALPLMVEPLPIASTGALDITASLSSAGRRLAASIIDSFIFIAIAFIGLFIGALIDGDEEGLFMATFMIIAILCYLVGYAVHVSIKGRTLGKWMLGMRIVRVETGESGGFLYNYFLRSFVNYVIAAFVPFYSNVDVCFIFSSDKRCLHDRIAGTIVIDVRRVEAPRRDLNETANNYG
jgi:uncharacterized RDD family membrane protein YckC